MAVRRDLIIATGRQAPPALAAILTAITFPAEA